MKNDVQIQAVKAIPAIGGTVWYTFTLQEWVAIATLIYITAQIFYLAWKWWNEHKDRKNK